MRTENSVASTKVKGLTHRQGLLVLMWLNVLSDHRAVGPEHLTLFVTCRHPVSFLLSSHFLCSFVAVKSYTGWRQEVAGHAQLWPHSLSLQFLHRTVHVIKIKWVKEEWHNYIVLFSVIHCFQRIHTVPTNLTL